MYVLRPLDLHKSDWYNFRDKYSKHIDNNKGHHTVPRHTQLFLDTRAGRLIMLLASHVQILENSY